MAPQRLSYVERINLVIDRVHSDLAQPLRLNELAVTAGLSPFHFQRIFQAMVGESPSEFVKRLRLERALYLMGFGKEKSLTKIAFAVGFSSSSDFTRSFKSRYGVAPSKFDHAAWHAKQNHCIESATNESPFKLHKQPSRANPEKFRVRIRQLPPRKVAYIRVAKPYVGDGVLRAAQRLEAWAETRQLADGQWLGYQFESPRVTSLDKCQYCVAVETRSNFQPQGEVGLYRFPAMTVAEVDMSGDIDLELRLFQWLYGSWLPTSKYVPADHPCFEAWKGRPFAHGDQHFELCIQLPIR